MDKAVFTQRVLVTGATGFVGRHLCEALVSKGYIVRGTCRVSPPVGDPRLGGVEWCAIGDIGPDTNWGNALHRVDHVVHLAGLAHRIDSEEEALAGAFDRVNSKGTRRLAEAFRAEGTKGRLVFISSVKVVASKAAEILTEERRCAPDSPYGSSKLAAEEALNHELESAAGDWCVLRPCLIYGPGNLGNMARLLRLMKTGLPLPLGAINNKRSFLYVGNLVDLIECSLNHPRASRQTFLVSDGEIVSTPQLLRLLSRQAQAPCHLWKCPLWMLWGGAKVGDLLRVLVGRSVGWDSYAVERLTGSLAVDPHHLASQLEWTPPWIMEDGIRLTLAGNSYVPGQIKPT